VNKMIKKHMGLSRLYLILMMMLSLLMLPTTVIRAETAVEPQALIQDATERMLQALKDNKTELEADSSVIYGLVKEILIPNFDFAKMSKLALGKNWRKASDVQKTRFTEEFRLLLVRTYSTAMLEYTDEKIHFLPFKGDLSKKKVKVKMDVIQAGGPSIPMAMSLYLNSEGAWKVYDLKIDGISLVTNYRSTFATEIRNDGMDKLIDRLASKNEKVKA